MLAVWARGGDYDSPVGTRYVPERGTVARAVFESRRPGRITGQEDRRSAAGAPVIVEGRLWGVVVVRSANPALPVDTEARLAEVTALLATAIANAESREELKRLAEEQAALRRVATLVAQGAQPETLFAIVAEEVARVAQVPFVSIVRYEPNGSATERATFSELEHEIAEAVRRAGIRSRVAIPIVVAGHAWGAMVVSAAELEPLSESNAARLADFTELVGIAIANAESRTELEASRARTVATADATRRQIERDLHDGAQQHLVSLALELSMAREAVPTEFHRHRAELARTLEGLTSVLEELREIARGIHPAHVGEVGLGRALKTLADRSAVRVQLDVRAGAQLPERIQITVYYIVSESLANAAKYAQASVVCVTMEERDRVLHVSIRDDGRGGADPTRGSGLLGLKDRAEAIGGRMSLQSLPGAGTSIEIDLPLDEPLQEDHVVRASQIR
jgi:signal transduction histidine kinase